MAIRKESERTRIGRAPREDSSKGSTRRSRFGEGTFLKEAWKAMEAAGFSLDNATNIRDGRIAIQWFVTTLDVLANPLHEKNLWSSAVRIVRRRGTLRFEPVHRFPTAVKEYWTRNGYPPKGRIRYLTPLGVGDAAARNPFTPGSDEHFVFERASRFRPRKDILAEAESALKKSSSAVKSIWARLADPDHNEHGICEERKPDLLPDGTVLVRLYNPVVEILDILLPE